MTEINKHLPLPSTRSLPWDQLEIGDSFLVPFNDTAPTVIRTRINALCQYFRKVGGKRMSYKTQPDGIRVWRTS